MAYDRGRQIPLLFSTTAALYAAVGGLLTLAGWAANVPGLTDWKHHGISMFPNTAVCASLSGIAVILRNHSRDRCRTAVQGLATIVALIGALTLLEHLTGLNLGIDTALFNRRWGQRAADAPMRMGPPASLSFFMTGLALLLLSVGRRASAIGSAIAVLVAAIATLSLIGFIYSAHQMYTLPRLTGIAMQTASMIFAVGLAMVASAPDVEPMRALLDPGAAGKLARRALPLSIFFALGLGWLRVIVQNQGWVDVAFGTALRTIVEIALLTGLLWWAVVMVRAHTDALGQSEAELRRQGRQLAAFLETAAICLHRVGPDGVILWANQAELQTMGYPRERYIGRNIAEFHVDQHQIAGILDRLHRGETLIDCEAQVRCQDGSVKTVLIDASVLWDEGRFIHTQCFTRDITARKGAEQELAENARRKDEFLATLAHELRNPLAPIRNGLEALPLLRDQPQEMAATRAMMLRQLNHLVRLVDDLLDASRISRGKLQLRKQHVELAPIIQEAVEACRPQIDSAQLQLKVAIPDEPIYLNADPVRLAQVFGNLLANAAKFIEPGGRIWLTARHDGSQVAISVRDTGIGIPADMLPRIFEMFTQVDRSLERSRGGLGIGLSLVKLLVEMHCGSVSGHSDGEGRGSEFVVRLPVLGAAPHAQVEPLSKRVEPLLRRILVVDDNHDSARTLAMLLKYSGSDTQIAHDGLEAVEKAAQYRPDVVLLDIGLPKMNGYEVCRAIRSNSAGPGPAIIALTGWGQEEDRRKSREAGFNAHLVKPIDYAVLTDLLESLAVDEPGAD